MLGLQGETNPCPHWPWSSWCFCSTFFLNHRNRDPNLRKLLPFWKSCSFSGLSQILFEEKTMKTCANHHPIEIQYVWKKLCFKDREVLQSSTGATAQSLCHHQQHQKKNLLKLLCFLKLKGAISNHNSYPLVKWHSAGKILMFNMEIDLQMINFPTSHVGLRKCWSVISHVSAHFFVVVTPTIPTEF